MHRWLTAMAGHAAWQTSCREESMTARKTKILLDSGDADETQRIKKLSASKWPNTAKSLRSFRLWSETREFRLKCSETRILRPRRCSIRLGKCSRGFLMPL